MLNRPAFGEISVDSLQAMRIGFLLGPLPQEQCGHAQQPMRLELS